MVYQNVCPATYSIESLSQAVRTDPGSEISNILKLSSALSDEEIEYFRFDNCPKHENHENRKERQIKKLTARRSASKLWEDFDRSIR